MTPDALLLLAITALELALMSALFGAIYGFAARLARGDELIGLALAVLLLGTLGYLAFWIACLGTPAFIGFRCLVGIAMMAQYAVMLRDGSLADHMRRLREPALFVTLLFVVLIMLEFAGGGIDNPQRTAATRF